MKLQVVKTDKGYVAVSDEPIRCDEASGLIRNIWYVFEGIIYKREYSHPKNSSKIVATDTTFKLKGIPQFELEKEVDILKRLANDSWEGCHGCDESDKNFWINGFIHGYKTAKSKGCFTEEDIRKAYRSNGPLNKEDEFIDSLKQPKKLVAIEVETQKVPVISDKEYEELEKGTREYTDTKPFDVELVVPQNKSEQYPDGILTIKQYFYE